MPATARIPVRYSGNCEIRHASGALSAKTVRNHTEHIYAKTGAANRVTASLFAVEHGLVPQD